MKWLWLIFASVFMLSVESTWASDHGLFMVVKGSVKVISGQDKKETSAKVGSKVFSGDTVVTEADSRAKIVMSDRNVLQLSPDTRFEITKYKTGATETQREAQVALMQGKVRVQVEQKYNEKNKFELRTPTAVAGVRGTQYVAQFEPQSQTTTILVLTGKVAVSVPKPGSIPVVLTPNMGSTIKEDTNRIEPVRMSPEDIQGMTGETTTKTDKSEKSEAPKESRKTDSASEATTEPVSGEAAPKANSTSPAPADKSLVTNDIVGGEVLSNDSKLQSTMQQKPPASPVSAAPTLPTMNVPKPPPTNPMVKEVNQITNSKTKVIVTPRPK